jgi:DNA-binding NarL/FixJ family response regulator
LIADDHALFRRGLVELLSELPELTLVGEAEDAERAVHLTLSEKPDIVLMDVHMPQGGGIEAVRRIKAETSVPVLMLTVSERDEDLAGALDAGADGYLLKNAEPEELVDAVRHVAAGHGYLSPEVTPQVVRRARMAPAASETGVSRREQQVLAALASGATNAQIGLRLSIAPSTVKSHLRNLYKKLGAANRAEAVALAAKLGLLASTKS